MGLLLKNSSSGHCSCSPHILLTTKVEDKRSLKLTHFKSYFTGLVSGQELCVGVRNLSVEEAAFNKM